MRIAFFSRELPSDRPNGVSIQVDRLATALVRRGHQVEVCSFSPAPAEAVYTHRLCRWRFASALCRLFETAWRFRSCARSVDADILHFHGDDWLVRGRAGRVRTFYGTALYEALHARTLRRRLRQAFLYGCEIVSSLRRGSLTCISQSTARVLPRAARVIPCGIPLDRYRPGAARSAHPSILFIGDLDSRKRGRLLCDTFLREVLPILSDAELIVVGPQPVSGPHIRWAGVLPDEALIRELQSAWVLCQPSSYEGFGVPALEAMACGAAVVASPSAGVREVVADGISGIHAPDGALGASLIRVLSDTVLREHLVAGGRIAAARYDIDRIAAEFEEIYTAARGVPCTPRE